MAGRGAAHIRVTAARALIDLDRAVPLGLIVNELVTNATRHGGAVEVQFHRHGDRYRLSLRDDGPVHDNRPPMALPVGLAMQLIDGFVRRLQGQLRLSEEDGLAIVVEFPVLAAKHDDRRPPSSSSPPATVASGAYPC